ncbi:MAG: hypothetical protein ACRDPC_13620 [Solirubrobacteraceae bacterium]
MPVPPAELSARCHIEGEAARATAAASGLAHDAGPGETILTGPRADVLAALVGVIEASLDAGARTLDVRLEAPTETRGGQTP